jgi:hypothetical protein
VRAGDQGEQMILKQPTSEAVQRQRQTISGEQMT